MFCNITWYWLPGDGPLGIELSKNTQCDIVIKIRKNTVHFLVECCELIKINLVKK